MEKITISVDDISFSAWLLETPTARLIAESLPIEGRCNIWGNEIYFEIPISIEAEPDARSDVEVGELGYWPGGSAFCIFFGPTPMSKNDRPKAAADVNVFGHITGDCSPLRSVSRGMKISVFRE
ncbi:MAG: cyclophilin-like fold protein [Dehalococcoidia bacterium]